jgi:hypothetical protein
MKTLAIDYTVPLTITFLSKNFYAILSQNGFLLFSPFYDNLEAKRKLYR